MCSLKEAMGLTDEKKGIKTARKTVSLKRPAAAASEKIGEKRKF